MKEYRGSKKEAGRARYYGKSSKSEIVKWNVANGITESMSPYLFLLRFTKILFKGTIVAADGPMSTAHIRYIV